MAAKKTYKGFSTINAEYSNSWMLTDIELIKRDLLNHFMTRQGERIMRPNFGSKIWDYIFEQLTSSVREEIINDVTRICQSDPRVNLIQTFILDYDQGIRTEMTLEFVGWDLVDTMFVTFQRNQALAYSGEEF